MYIIMLINTRNVSSFSAWHSNIVIRLRFVGQRLKDGFMHSASACYCEYRKTYLESISFLQTFSLDSRGLCPEHDAALVRLTPKSSAAARVCNCKSVHRVIYHFGPNRVVSIFRCLTLRTFIPAECYIAFSVTR